MPPPRRHLGNWDVAAGVVACSAAVAVTVAVASSGSTDIKNDLPRRTLPAPVAPRCEAESAITRVAKCEDLATSYSEDDVRDADADLRDRGVSQVRRTERERRRRERRRIWVAGRRMERRRIWAAGRSSDYGKAPL